MSDEPANELDALQREMGLGIDWRWGKQVVDAFGSEGDLMAPRTALGLWAEFSEEYCASWLICDKSTMGNFAGWLINSRKIVPVPDPRETLRQAHLAHALAVVKANQPQRTDA